MYLDIDPIKVEKRTEKGKSVARKLAKNGLEVFVGRCYGLDSKVFDKYIQNIWCDECWQAGA